MRLVHDPESPGQTISACSSMMSASSVSSTDLEDRKPLVARKSNRSGFVSGGGGNGGGTEMMQTTTARNAVSFRKFMIVGLIIIVLAGLYLVLHEKEEAVQQPNHSITTKPSNENGVHENIIRSSTASIEETTISKEDEKEEDQTYKVSSSTWTISVSDYMEHTVLETDDPSRYDVSHLRQRFQESKSTLIEKLRNDYGSRLFDKMAMMDTEFSLGRLGLASPSASAENNDSSFNVGGGVSWDRMKRKLLIKLLRVQLLALTSPRNNRQRSYRRLGDTSSPGTSGIDDDTTWMVPFIWATGGHSAAAGHGNYYNESYTAVLERNLQALYGSVGIQFVGRNYAMGGTASGPEVAFCVDAIFGTDIDVLSWDFGMTDGRNTAAMELYCRHAAMQANHPACVGVQIGRSKGNDRLGVLRDLEELGMTALYTPQSVYESTIDLIPDSLSKTTTELEEMPPLVRYFKCDKGLEKGDICGENKYTDGPCPTRRFKTSWHPGWKWHALIGNMITLSMMDLLDDALKELEALVAVEKDHSVLLQELVDQENKEYANLQNKALSGRASKILEESGAASDFDLGVVFKERGVCRTARLPAETRHRGIMTETKKVGFTSFEEGMSRIQADGTVNGSDFLRLVDGGERQECEAQLNMDYKDYFYLSAKEDWKSIVLPNDAEIELYRTRELQPPLKGLIAFCLVGCNWGKCPGGDIREDGIASGAIEITVNGVKVTNTLNVQTNVFLRHDNGFYFEPNSEGRFEIRFHVNTPDMYIRFSSFMVW